MTHGFSSDDAPQAGAPVWILADALAQGEPAAAAVVPDGLRVVAAAPDGPRNGPAVAQGGMPACSLPALDDSPAVAGEPAELRAERLDDFLAGSPEQPSSFPGAVARRDGWPLPPVGWAERPVWFRGALAGPGAPQDELLFRADL